jgi:hypothetical protein
MSKKSQVDKLHRTEAQKAKHIRPPTPPASQEDRVHLVESNLQEIERCIKRDPEYKGDTHVVFVLDTRDHFATDIARAVAKHRAVPSNVDLEAHKQQVQAAGMIPTIIMTSAIGMAKSLLRIGGNPGQAHLVSLSIGSKMCSMQKDGTAGNLEPF